MKLASSSYLDVHDDYLAFLKPRFEEMKRLLRRSGSLYFHIDYREVHYCKVLLDLVFGRECFLNEVIWAYDYGARTTKKWPPKHDNILVYVRDPEAYYFDAEAVERIPYMAPGLVGPEKAARPPIKLRCGRCSAAGSPPALGLDNAKVASGAATCHQISPRS